MILIIWKYIFNIGCLFSCIINTILGGTPKETLSERSGRAYRHHGKFWLRDLINALFFFQEDHCEDTLRDDFMGEVWKWSPK